MMQVLFMFMLLHPTQSLLSTTSMCRSVLLHDQRVAGYNKFYDISGCLSNATDCDVLNCRLCVYEGTSAAFDHPTDLPRCSEPETTLTLTTAQEVARRTIGITRRQMEAILNAVKGCTSFLTDLEPLSEEEEDALNVFCQDDVSEGHLAFGISSMYSPHCVDQPGCIAARLMHNAGGCRYCRLPDVPCTGDCQSNWIECPFTSTTMMALSMQAAGDVHSLNNNHDDDDDGVSNILTIVCVAVGGAMGAIFFVALTIRYRIREQHRELQHVQTTLPPQ